MLYTFTGIKILENIYKWSNNFIFVVGATFRLLCLPAFIRYMLIEVTYREFSTKTIYLLYGSRLFSFHCPRLGIPRP